MIKLAVFGYPVAQSLSPRIHDMFARQAGLDISYEKIEATPEAFEARLREFADSGARGCNVTLPHKQAAWSFAEQRSASAEHARTANTLVFEPRKPVYADNTDGRGLVNDLQQNLDCRLRGARLCLLGAGGAASGVIADLLNTQPAELVIANRTAEKATDLAARHPGASASELNRLGGFGQFDVVINATSLGHRGGVPDVPPACFAAGALLYDMNYGPAATPLAEWCRSHNIRHQPGLGMLVEQAALSFQLWTNYQPDTRPVLAELTA